MKPESVTIKNIEAAFAIDAPAQAAKRFAALARVEERHANRHRATLARVKST